MNRHRARIAGGELVGVLGLALFIVAESPDATIVGGMGSETLALAVFTVGIMGRGLAKALAVKPDPMSSKYVTLAWGIPFFAAVMTTVDITGMDLWSPMEAILIVCGLSAAFSLAVGSIEARDDETVEN